MIKPLLHLVFGGEVDDAQTLDYRDLDNIDMVGIFPSHASALDAWRAASQGHLDNARLKYVIVHLKRLLEAFWLVQRWHWVAVRMKWYDVGSQLCVIYHAFGRDLLPHPKINPRKNRLRYDSTAHQAYVSISALW